VCLLLQSFFAERFFALFDSDGSGSISLDELLKALNLLIHGNETDKLRFLFQVYDVDGQFSHTHIHSCSVSRGSLHPRASSACRCLDKAPDLPLFDSDSPTLGPVLFFR